MISKVKQTSRWLKSFLIVGVLLLSAAPKVSAQLTQCDINDLIAQHPYYSTCDQVASCNQSTSVSGSSSNLDYAGNPILTQQELQALAQNEPVYQQAAQEAGIPWQALAAIHYRETDFSLDATHAGPNGQYQITSKNYPYTGELTQQEFLAESIDAANFIKKDWSGSDSASVKNTFYRYNGPGAPTYPEQAADLGYNPDTQAYEGSPYVMNRADAARDSTLPAVANSGKWLQYGTGPKGGLGPAGQAYGAYVVYASVSGITLSGGCSSGSVNCSPVNSTQTSSLSQTRQNIVCIAEQELALWNNGTMKAGTDFEKYTLQRNEEWCADFVSWVYNQAGYPFGPIDSEGQNWSIPYVGNLIVPPQDGNKFVYHQEPNYTPQPGDLAIHYSTQYSPPYFHVNIVDSVSPGKIVLIGGDQHGGGSPDTNVVNTEIVSSPTDDSIIGYVGPD